LTLPGIAGIILTIGMAVDANVLIFERIREELRLGKTPAAAIDAGYGKALLTILDANVTTLIAALVLFQFGTGAIRGFAITLSIGIASSLFTAIYVTRLVFDLALHRFRIKHLSI
jgi:preprotein translocase subunit SecD